MLRFIASLFLALTSIASVSAGTFGECSCRFKDGHVQKFQVSDCKASACYIECRQNAGGVQESCITKNQDAVNLAGPGRCQCGKGIYDVASCDSDECFNHCDKQKIGHGVCVTKTRALAMALAPTMSCDACFAKFADLPADDQAKICNKIVKCVPAAPLIDMWPNFAYAGVSFSDCSSPGHLLQVSDVSLNPNPPVRGQKVSITISGNLASDIESANAQLQVSLGDFQVLSQNFQLPGSAAGPVSQSVNILVPGFAPNGAYTAKGVITSGDQQLACLSVNFNLGAKNALEKEASIVIPCDKCLAKLADDLPADDAAFVCNKIIKCKAAVQTMAGGDGAVLG